MHNRETISRLLASTVGDGDSFSLGSLIHCAPISRAFCRMSNMTGRERWSLSATDHEPSALPGLKSQAYLRKRRCDYCPRIHMGAYFPLLCLGATDHLVLCASADGRRDCRCHADRRVGARSPGSYPSLSVTLSIGITSRPTGPPVPSAPDWRLAASVSCAA